MGRTEKGIDMAEQQDDKMHSEDQINIGMFIVFFGLPTIGLGAGLSYALVSGLIATGVGFFLLRICAHLRKLANPNS